MLHKTLSYHNKFVSMKYLRVYYWYFKIPQCGYMEHGCKYIKFYVQKHIVPQPVCYNPPLVHGKSQEHSHLWAGTIILLSEGQWSSPQVTQHGVALRNATINKTTQSTTWWCHQMETFSTLLALCVGNSLVTGEFPSQRPVTWYFDVFFDLRLNKRLSKQSWSWWFEMPSRSLWYHSNAIKLCLCFALPWFFQKQSDHNLIFTACPITTDHWSV